MKDMDFDELDKAVNSLLGSDDAKSKASAPLNVPQRPVPAPRPAQKVSVTSEESAPTPAAVPPVPKSDSAQSNLIKTRPMMAKPAARRAGSFIDVVNPAAAKPAAAAPSRSGNDLKPINTDVKPDEEAEKKPDTDEKPEEAKPEVIAPATPPASEATPKATAVPEHPASKSDFPDPLDFHGFKDGEKPAEPAKEHADAKTLPATEDKPEKPAEDVSSKDNDKDKEKEEVPTEDKPKSDSPFLPETKVEKRPLGAFSDYKGKEEPPTTDQPPPAETGTAATPKPESQVFMQPVPPTLTNELIAVESGEVPEWSGNPEPPKETKDEPEDKKTDKKEDKPAKETTEDADKDKDKEANPFLSGGSSPSIPQQYHTEDQPVDKTSHPVFDTKEYHPPLVTAHAQSTSHKMLTYILVALIVAALGAACYFGYLYYISL